MAAKKAQAAREARENAEAAATAAWGAREAERRRWNGGPPSMDATAEARRRQQQAEDAFERLRNEREEEQRRAAEHAAELGKVEKRAEARAAYIAGWVKLQPPPGGAAGASSAGASSGASGDAASVSASVLRRSDFPWPRRRSEAPFTPEEVAGYVLSEEIADRAARRRALQAELRRWHPDKFTAKFGGRLVEAERGAVLEDVKAVSQCLNALMASGSAA